MAYSQRYWLLYGLLFLVLSAGITTSMLAQGRKTPNCTEFGFDIPGLCCCTNDCCREAEPREFTHLGGATYRSNVTGQEIDRKGYSPDGRFIKCACTMTAKGWTKLPTSTIFCIFPPIPKMM